MIDPVYLIGSSVQYDVQRLNTISNNAANALTPGFKREFLSLSGQYDFSMPPLLSTTLSSNVDYRPGVYRQTSRSLDFTISGKGYFEIDTIHGRAYTRTGAFRLDENGTLVTQQGDAVYGVNGKITLLTDTPVVDGQGQVYENGKLIAQLKIVDVAQSDTLQHIGGGIYLQQDNTQAQLLDNPKVVQGGLESSNVDSASEMVSLIETMRHYELSHKVMQAYDDLSDKMVRNLGQF